MDQHDQAQQTKVSNDPNGIWIIMDTMFLLKDLAASRKQE